MPSDLTREELRDVQMRGADAERLLNDPTLWDVFRAIRVQATHTAVYGPNGSDRDQGRMLVVAIDLLATELRDRIDTATARTKAQQQARAYE